MAPPIPGTDKPQPSQTVGWKLNHICFRIADPERTTHFYRDILGMRTVFTVDCGSFTILYFGYPEVEGVHETGEEMLRKRHDREGLIEFIHIHVTAPLVVFLCDLSFMTLCEAMFCCNSYGYRFAYVVELAGIDDAECRFQWVFPYGDYGP